MARSLGSPWAKVRHPICGLIKNKKYWAKCSGSGLCINVYIFLKIIQGLIDLSVSSHVPYPGSHGISRSGSHYYPRCAQSVSRRSPWALQAWQLVLVNSAPFTWRAVKCILRATTIHPSKNNFPVCAFYFIFTFNFINFFSKFYYFFFSNINT